MSHPMAAASSPRTLCEDESNTCVLSPDGAENGHQRNGSGKNGNPKPPPLDKNLPDATNALSLCGASTGNQKNILDQGGIAVGRNDEATDISHIKRQKENKGSNLKKRHKIENSHLSGHMVFEKRGYPLLQYTDHLDAQGKIESHFNKKYIFRIPSDTSEDAWKLPAAETMFNGETWQDEEQQASKAELNEVKGQLTDKDIGIWNDHTRNTNPAEKIAVAVRRKAEPEMVTQAWLKFYEIISTYEVLGLEDWEVEENKKDFCSVHLCEAPGAFIVALNHYLAVHNFPVKWQWLATTLNPYYEGSPSEFCVMEDKLIYHTSGNWTFGQDNTGDLMKSENYEDLVQRANYMGPINVVTADGSIDCQVNPGEQEIITHNLHMCEVLTSLSILSPGGSLVLKLFTLYERETISMMYFLCCVFKNVCVVKPGTSKEGNSEVYVLCNDYRGKGFCEPHLAKLVIRYGSFTEDLVMFNASDIPESFLVQIRKCSRVFKNHQIKTIQRNLDMFKVMDEKAVQFNDLMKFKANALFFNRNYCVKIDKNLSLTDYKINKGRNLLESDLNKPITSSLVREKDPVKKFALLKGYLSNYADQFDRKKVLAGFSYGEGYRVTRLPSCNLDDIEFDVLRGLPYTVIKSSKLCSHKIQEAYREFCNICDGLEKLPALTLDDDVLALVMKEYPEAKVLKSEIDLRPTYSLGALLETLVMLKKQQLSQNDSLIISNLTLLSRLQCGLLCLLSSAFENIAFYYSPKVGDKAPVIVLERFKSSKHGEAVMTTLHNKGWNPFDSDNVNSTKVLQLVSFPYLAAQLRLCNFYYYNLNYYLHRSLNLQKSLEIVLKS